MPPLIHTYSDEINYLVWRYLRETSMDPSFLSLPSHNLVWLIHADLTQTAWTLEAEIKSRNGKDIVAVHEEFGRNFSFDLPKRLRMSLQYQEVLKHMTEVYPFPIDFVERNRMGICLVLRLLHCSQSTNVIKETIPEYRFLMS